VVGGSARGLYRLAWVFQGLVFALALVVFGLWWAGKDAPVGWLILDCAFGAYNVWWLTPARCPACVRWLSGQAASH